jgi:hypothetical protein
MSYCAVKPILGRRSNMRGPGLNIQTMAQVQVVYQLKSPSFDSAQNSVQSQSLSTAK